LCLLGFRLLARSVAPARPHRPRRKRRRKGGTALRRAQRHNPG